MENGTPRQCDSAARILDQIEREDFTFELPVRMTLKNVATTDKGITIKIAFSPKTINSEKHDIISVYVTRDYAHLCPLKIFGNCNQMWGFGGSQYACYYSTILKGPNEGSPTFRVFGARFPIRDDRPSDDKYVGQIVVLSRWGKRLTENGTVEIPLPKNDRSCFYRKSGALYIWMAKHTPPPIWMARQTPPPPPRADLSEAGQMAASVIKVRSGVSNVLTTEIVFDN